MLHEPDPTWPDQAARLLARLRQVLGDVLVTADHVGSTAVPGLIAKDVVDLQLGVRALADVDDPAVLERLRQAGFPLAEGVRSDVDRGSQGEWPKRMLGSADPGRVAHIHVREVGSEGWRWALVFRRLDAGRRRCPREYAVEKQRLAATIDTVSEYADAKEPWFDSVHDRAQAWAEATGWHPRRWLTTASRSPSTGSATNRTRASPSPTNGPPCPGCGRRWLSWRAASPSCRCPACRPFRRGPPCWALPPASAAQPWRRAPWPPGPASSEPSGCASRCRAAGAGGSRQRCGGAGAVTLVLALVEIARQVTPIPDRNALQPERDRSGVAADGDHLVGTACTPGPGGPAS